MRVCFQNAFKADFREEMQEALETLLTQLAAPGGV